MTSPETSDGLLKKIRAKRRRIATFVEKLEPRGVRLTNLSIVCGAIATVLTAGPAIGGKTLTDALGAVGPNSPSWRILCGAAAVLSLIATIATNLYKSHDVASRLAKAQACDAKLEGLEILVELGQLDNKEAVTRYDACISRIDFPMLEAGRRRLAPSLDSVNGSIDKPSPNQVVEDAFLCAGEVHGLE